MSCVINFLWLGLDFPPEKKCEDTIFRRPIPLEYLSAIKNCALENTGANIRLWIDSKRLFDDQIAFLQEQTMQNRITLMNLRDIPAYNREGLFNTPEKNRLWRDDKRSLIWRQVDAAKILICLQGSFDQVFFVDMDLASIVTDDPKIQSMLKKQGILLNMSPDYPRIENQLWAFDRVRRQGFFEELYKNTLKEAYKGENGWWSLVTLADEKLFSSEHNGGEGLQESDIVLSTRESGIRSTHPDHRLAFGLGDVNAAFAYKKPKQTLSEVFAQTVKKASGVIKSGFAQSSHFLKKKR